MRKEDIKILKTAVILWVLLVALGIVCFKTHDRESSSEFKGFIKEIVIEQEHGNDTLYVDERGVVIDFVIKRK